jgi:hypothetical protein
MSITTLSRLSQVLRVSTDYLLFGDNRVQAPGQLEELVCKIPPEKTDTFTELVQLLLKLM